MDTEESADYAREDLQASKTLQSGSSRRVALWEREPQGPRKILHLQTGV